MIRSDSNSLDPLTKEKVLPHAIEKMLLSKRGAMLWQRFQGSQEFIELRISRRQQKNENNDGYKKHDQVSCYMLTNRI